MEAPSGMMRRATPAPPAPPRGDSAGRVERRWSVAVVVRGRVSAKGGGGLVYGVRGRGERMVGGGGDGGY